MSSKHIFIVDAGKKYGHSEGELNHALADFAVQVLRENGCETRLTRVEDGYEIEPEIANYLWADVVIYQQPGWWMGPPWTLKKYLDEVLTAGHGKLYDSDGRTRSDASKKYGSGGLLHDKKYLISSTWNAPLEAFTDPEQFFEGKGIEGVYLHFHKLNQFIGMHPLPSFSCHDVMKDPDIEGDFKRYRKHLEKYICKA